MFPSMVYLYGPHG